MKPAIVSMCSREYLPLAELTIEQNKRPYCERYGYDLYFNVVDSTSSKTAGYDRFQWILNRLMAQVPNEWFWIQGVDTAIMNFNIRMEEFIDDQYHFIIARDPNALNADSILLRNSEEGENFVRALLASRKWFTVNRLYADSSAITEYQTRPEWEWMIKVVPQKSFNSMDFPIYNQPDVYHAGLPGQFTDGDFLLHWGAKPLDQRLILAAEGLKRVIR